MIQQTSPLTAVLSEVLANMAFLFTEPPPDGAAAPASWLDCTISYRGPKRGQLTLRSTPQFALTLAANLLDIDPDSPEAASQGQDAMRELVNVLCGQLVTTVHGQQAAFDLTIPEITECGGEEQPAAGDSIETWVDGQPVRLVHVIEE